MSLRVLIIPEDFVLDQYILKPLIEAMFKEMNRPRAQVHVCQNPRLEGIDQARNPEVLQEIIDVYRYKYDVFLLLVDQDGKPGRKKMLDKLRASFNGILHPGKTFDGILAEQEVEIWALAGLKDLPKDWKWDDLRNEVDFKERFFLPYVEARGIAQELGKGRSILGLDVAANYQRIRDRCPEVQELEVRLRAWLDQRGFE